VRGEIVSQYSPHQRESKSSDVWSATYHGIRATLFWGGEICHFCCLLRVTSETSRGETALKTTAAKGGEALVPCLYDLCPEET
jgi:hypothetical protein